jgi:hypothetical protein
VACNERNVYSSVLLEHLTHLIAGGLRETGHQSFREASLLSRPTVTQRIRIQRLSPESKGGFPYIPFRAGYRNGGYILSHTWSRIISLAILTSGLEQGDPSLISPQVLCVIPQSIVFFKFHCCSYYLSLSPFPLPAFLPHSSL